MYIDKDNKWVEVNAKDFDKEKAKELGLPVYKVNRIRRNMQICVDMLSGELSQWIADGDYDETEKDIYNYAKQLNVSPYIFGNWRVCFDYNTDKEC